MPSRRGSLTSPSQGRSTRSLASPAGSTRSARSTRSGPSRRGSQRSEASRLSTSQGTERDHSGYCSTSSGEEDSGSVASLIQGSIAAGSVTSSGSRNYGYSNSQGLELPYQKVLLNDIEDNGGLESFTKGLTHFLNSRLALKDAQDRSFFGNPRTKPRFRVENKIKHWKGLSSEEYEELLTQCEIVPARFREKKVPDSVPSQVTVPTSSTPSQEAPRPDPVSSTGAAVPDATPSQPIPAPVHSKGRKKQAAGDFVTYRDTTQSSSSEDERPSTMADSGDSHSRIKIIDGVVTGRSLDPLVPSPLSPQ